MAVPPQSLGTIYAEQPVYRVWGDFVVKVGNTTYDLKNVYFESPRLDNQPPGGAYSIEITPLTAEALAALPPGTSVVVMDEPSAA